MFQASTVAFSWDISISKVRKLSWVLQPKKAEFARGVQNFILATSSDIFLLLI